MITYKALPESKEEGVELRQKVIAMIKDCLEKTALPKEAPKVTEPP